MNQFKAFLFFFLISRVLSAQVTIRLTSLPFKYTPSLDTLFLAGNFNAWNPRNLSHRFIRNNQGQFEATVSSNLPSLEYKITRGTWASVEVSATGLDIPNRVLQNTPGLQAEIPVLDWADTKGTHTATNQVQVLGSQVWLASLKRYRRIWVCLPTQYQTQTGVRYPVMYFHDGQNVFDAATSFSGEWKVDEAMVQLENQASGVPFIAVGIDNGGGERLNELTPFRHPNYNGGQGEKYAQDIVESVKPLIDSLFRTLPDEQNTGVGGSSLGGIETLFMAYRYPTVFSKALIFSPSLWFSDSLRQYCVAQNQPVNSRLYWVCGTNEGDADMIPDMNQCYQDLLTAGMPALQMRKTIVTGGTHSEGFWSQQVKAGLDWLFRPTTGTKKKEPFESTLKVQREGGRLWVRSEQNGQTFIVECYDLQGRKRGEFKAFSGSASFTEPTTDFLILKITNEKGTEIIRIPPSNL